MDITKNISLRHIVAVTCVACAVILAGCELCSDSTAAPTRASLDSTVIVNSIGMTFRRVPAGMVKIGSPRDEPYRWDCYSRYEQIDPNTAVDAYEPVRTCRIEEPLWIAAHETTNSQLRRAYPSLSTALPDTMRIPFPIIYPVDPSARDLKESEKRKALSSIINRDDHPAACVSWLAAKAFCKWLSDLPAERAAGRSYRLPTEQEWEYACRAGAETRLPWGIDDREAPKYCNRADKTFGGVWPNDNALLEMADGHIVSAPVGSFEPNRFGLYDMLGNVWELCENEYMRFRQDGTAYPLGVSSVAVRGGSWMSVRSGTRCAARVAVGRGDPRFDVGFRLILITRSPSSESVSTRPSE